MQPAQRLSQNGKYALAAFQLILIAAAMVVFFPFNAENPGYHIDFDVYWTGTRFFLNGGYIYGKIPLLHHGTSLPFTYPPVALLVFVPFAILPYQLSSILFSLVSLLALYVVARYTFTAVRSYGVMVEDKPWHNVFLWVAIIVALFTAPVRFTFLFGQINLLLMMLVTIDCCTSRRRWWTGMLVGLTISIKLTPMVFLLYFVCRRDWKSVGMTLGSFLVYNLFALLVMPSTTRLYWTKIIRDSERIGAYHYCRNQSINGALARFGLHDSSRSTVWFIVALIVGVLIAVIVWQLVKAQQYFAALMLNGIAANLCSPISWDHHWTWIVPLVILLGVWAWKKIPTSSTQWVWWTLTGLGALILFTDPLRFLPMNGDKELSWTPIQHFFGESYTLWSLLTIIALLAVRPFSRLTNTPRTIKKTSEKAPVSLQ